MRAIGEPRRHIQPSDEHQRRGVSKGDIGTHPRCDDTTVEHVSVLKQGTSKQSDERPSFSSDSTKDSPAGQLSSSSPGPDRDTVMATLSSSMTVPELVTNVPVSAAQSLLEVRQVVNYGALGNAREGPFLTESWNVDLEGQGGVDATMNACRKWMGVISVIVLMVSTFRATPIFHKSPHLSVAEALLCRPYSLCLRRDSFATTSSRLGLECEVACARRTLRCT